MEAQKFDEHKFVWDEEFLGETLRWTLPPKNGYTAEEIDFMRDLHNLWVFDFPLRCMYRMAKRIEPSLQTRLELVNEVLNYGETKYFRDGWMHVPNKFVRYRSALVRHAIKDPRTWCQQGPEFYTQEDRDEESGLLHKAHFLCNLYILMEMRC